MRSVEDAAQRQRGGQNPRIGPIDATWISSRQRVGDKRSPPFGRKFAGLPDRDDSTGHSMCLGPRPGFLLVVEEVGVGAPLLVGVGAAVRVAGVALRKEKKEVG